MADLRGVVVRDVDRRELGRVQAVLLDPLTMDARWLQIDGPGGSVLVPAAAASQAVTGELLVPYPADVVHAAGYEPGTALAAERAEQLRELYGFTD